MKISRILRSITIILSVLIVILDIVLFVNTNRTYENMEMFATVFNFGIFIYGLILILIVWIQYFLILGIIKVYKKYTNIKKWVFTTLLSVIEVGLIVLQIGILKIIFLFMGIVN